MLWMKAWLETRWRLGYVFALCVLILFMAAEGGGLGSTENADRLKSMVFFVSIFAAVNLAGAGIRTQSSFRRRSGLHGSTYFTLALPVSRFRLLAVRAALGFTLTAGVNAFMVVSTWLLFPLVRGSSTLVDLLQLLFAGITCVTSFYVVSVCVATLLDDTWQIYGSMAIYAAAWWISSQLSLPASFNVFRVMGDASPLRTHTLPWPAMIVSLAASILLFFSALRMVETHEY